MTHSGGSMERLHRAGSSSQSYRLCSYRWRLVWCCLPPGVRSPLLRAAVSRQPARGVRAESLIRPAAGAADPESANSTTPGDARRHGTDGRSADRARRSLAPCRLSVSRLTRSLASLAAALLCPLLGSARLVQSTAAQKKAIKEFRAVTSVRSATAERATGGADVAEQRQAADGRGGRNPACCLRAHIVLLLAR
jgi:hypothetical protein